MFNKNLLLILLNCIMIVSYAEETILFPSSKDLCSKILRRDAEVHLTDGNLDVIYGLNDPWPVITFTGKWDMSNAARINVEVRNLGKKTVRLQMLIYDKPNVSYDKSLNSAIYIAPGKTELLTIPLKHLSSGAMAFDGMKQKPEGLPVAKGIDLKNVVAISLCKMQNNAREVLQIRRIFTEGKYHALNVSMPMIDRFGQYCHAEWPGKIHNEKELQETASTEVKDLAAHPGIADFDQYGGWKPGPQLKATGRFRTEKYQGKWYLVDPDGKLFFSMGMNHVHVPALGSYTPLTDNRLKWFETLPEANNINAFYVVRTIYSGDFNGRVLPAFSFQAWNMFRKYGPNWKKLGEDLAVRRLQSWGFNTISWSDINIVTRFKMPFTISMALAGSPVRTLGGQWKVGSLWDVYDPSFARYVKSHVSGSRKLASSPWCLGIFFDNELHWNNEIGLLALKSPADQPAKLEFIRDLRKKYDSIEKLNLAWRTKYASWEQLLNGTEVPEAENARTDMDDFYFKTATVYFQTIRDTIKQQIPGCLYLGGRYSMVTPLAYKAAAQYCDVISFNYYRKNLDKFEAPGNADVPLLISEFHFGSTDRGMWGAGLVPVKSQAERAAGFQDYMNSALRHPQVVGCHWFEYSDQAFTGRTFDGENYNHGFLNVVDVPYPELVEAARRTASEMYPSRCK